MIESLMTVKDLSQYLKMNERTIYKWVRNGHIPVYKTLGCFRFKRNEIEQWLTKDRESFKKRNNNHKALEAKALSNKT